MSEPKTKVIRVREEAPGQVREYTWNRPGRNDYKSEGRSIKRVVDRNGVEYQPRWGDETIELFPGCTTSQKDGDRYIHVSSAACPVRVLHCEWFRYGGSGWEDTSEGEVKKWNRLDIIMAYEGLEIEV